MTDETEKKMGILLTMFPDSEIMVTGITSKMVHVRYGRLKRVMNFLYDYEINFMYNKGQVDFLKSDLRMID